MRTIKMTDTVGRFSKGQTVEVGNKSALYLVQHGYAEYDAREKNLPEIRRPKKQRRRVDALGTSDVLS